MKGNIMRKANRNKIRVLNLLISNTEENEKSAGMKKKVKTPSVYSYFFSFFRYDVFEID